MELDARFIEGARFQNLIPNSLLGVWSRGDQTPFGADLVSNGGFSSDVSDWLGRDATLDSIAGGQVGNCLELTRTGDATQAAYQICNQFTIGHIYLLTFYIKSGTSGNEAFKIGFTDSGDTESWKEYIEGTSSGTWTQYTVAWKADYTTAAIVLQKSTATVGTMLFDSVSCYELTVACIGMDYTAADCHSRTDSLYLYRIEDDLTHCRGYYGLQAVKGTSGPQYYNFFIDPTLRRLIGMVEGKTVAFGCWVYAMQDDNVKLQIRTTSPESVVESEYALAGTLTWMEIDKLNEIGLDTFQARVLFDGSNGNVAYISQPMLIIGSLIGEGRYVQPANEIILLHDSITSKKYDGSGKSDEGPTTMNLEIDTEMRLPKDVKAINASIEVNDSGSAAASGCYCSLLNGLDMTSEQLKRTLDGVPDDTQREAAGWVNCTQDGDYVIDTPATGSETMDVTLKIHAVQVS